MPSYMKSVATSRGFTLVELLVVIFIVTAAIIPIIIALNSIAQQANEFRISMTAAMLVREGMDIARNLRDSDWLNHPVPPFPNNGFGFFGTESILFNGN